MPAASGSWSGRPPLFRKAETILRHSHFEGDVADDMLRMLFICCDDAIPGESRLVLALKTLCGFSVAEIALRLFTTEANVYKRLDVLRCSVGTLTHAPALSGP